MAMESLYHSTSNLVVYLHPSKAKSPSDAILGELSSLLFTYNEALDGVPLAFDPKISSVFAQITSGISPSVGVRLRAELLLFSPKRGMIVEGEVVTVTTHAINAVVLGFSSASIAREEVRGEFRFRSRKGEYVSGVSKKHRIGVGTILRFRVRDFDGDTLHVSGSMVDDDTGCARWLDKNVDLSNQVEEMVSTKNSKRSGGKGVNVLVVDQNTTERVRLDEAKEQVLKKKSKKARVREEKGNMAADNGLVISEEMPMPSLKEDEKLKKSKKRRKEHS